METGQGNPGCERPTISRGKIHKLKKTPQRTPRRKGRVAKWVKASKRETGGVRSLSIGGKSRAAGLGLRKNEVGVKKSHPAAGISRVSLGNSS